MSHPKSLFSDRTPGYAFAGGVVVLLGILATASAQYQSSYPYSRSQTTSRQLPNSARHIGSGGIIGNPYTNTRTAPSGLPVSGNRHSYYGGGSRGNSLGGHQVSKPFSNLQRPQPLITSREAARIEVARGLWH